MDILSQSAGLSATHSNHRLQNEPGIFSCQKQPRHSQTKTQRCVTTWLVDDDFQPTEADSLAKEERRAKKIRKKQNTSFHTRVYEKLIQERQKREGCHGNSCSSELTSSDYEPVSDSDQVPYDFISNQQKSIKSRSNRKKKKSATKLGDGDITAQSSYLSAWLSVHTPGQVHCDKHDQSGVQKKLRKCKHSQKCENTDSKEKHNEPKQNATKSKPSSNFMPNDKIYTEHDNKIDVMKTNSQKQAGSDNSGNCIQNSFIWDPDGRHFTGRGSRIKCHEQRDGNLPGDKDRKVGSLKRVSGRPDGWDKHVWCQSEFGNEDVYRARPVRAVHSTSLHNTDTAAVQVINRSTQKTAKPSDSVSHNIRPPHMDSSYAGVTETAVKTTDMDSSTRQRFTETGVHYCSRKQELAPLLSVINAHVNTDNQTVFADKPTSPSQSQQQQQANILTDNTSRYERRFYINSETNKCYRDIKPGGESYNPHSSVPLHGCEADERREPGRDSAVLRTCPFYSTSLIQTINPRRSASVAHSASHSTSSGHSTNVGETASPLHNEACTLTDKSSKMQSARPADNLQQNILFHDNSTNQGHVLGSTDREEKHAVFLTERMEDYFVYKRNRQPWQDQTAAIGANSANVGEYNINIIVDKKQDPDNMRDRQCMSNLSAAQDPSRTTYTETNRHMASKQQQQHQTETNTVPVKQRVTNTRQWKMYLTELPIDPCDEGESYTADSVKRDQSEILSKTSGQLNLKKQPQIYSLEEKQYFGPVPATQATFPDKHEPVDIPVSNKSQKDIKLANLELHTKALMEEERRKYSEYKKAYEKQHSNEEKMGEKTSNVSSPMTSPLQSPVANDQLPNLLLRRVHHERQKAIIDEGEVKVNPKVSESVLQRRSSGLADESLLQRRSSGLADESVLRRRSSGLADESVLQCRSSGLADNSHKPSQSIIYGVTPDISKQQLHNVPAHVREDEPRRSAFQYVSKKNTDVFNSSHTSDILSSREWNYNDVYKQPGKVDIQPVFDFPDLEMEVVRRRNRCVNTYESEYRKSMDENMLNKRVPDPNLFYHEESRVRHCSGSDDNIRHKPPIAPGGAPALIPVRLSRSTQSLNLQKVNPLSKSEEDLCTEDTEKLSSYAHIIKMKDKAPVQSENTNSRSFIQGVLDNTGLDQNPLLMLKPIPRYPSNQNVSLSSEPEYLSNVVDKSNQQKRVFSDNHAEAESLYGTLDPEDKNLIADNEILQNYLHGQKGSVRRLSAENLRMHNLCDQRQISGSPSQDYTKRWIESKKGSFRNAPYSHNVTLDDHNDDDDVFIAVGPNDKPYCGKLYVNNLSAIPAYKSGKSVIQSEMISKKPHCASENGNLQAKKDNQIFENHSYMELLQTPERSTKVVVPEHFELTNRAHKEITPKTPIQKQVLDPVHFSDSSSDNNSPKIDNRIKLKAKETWRTQRAQSLPLDDDFKGRRRLKSDTNINKKVDQVRPRRHSLSKGVAAMVEKFCSDDRAQSLPDLTENSVFSVNYDTTGELVTDDPKHFKNANKHCKKTVANVIKKTKLSLLHLSRNEHSHSDSESYGIGCDILWQTGKPLGSFSKKDEKQESSSSFSCVEKQNPGKMTDKSQSGTFNTESEIPQLKSTYNPSPVNQDLFSHKKRFDKDMQFNSGMQFENDCSVEVLTLDEEMIGNGEKAKQSTLTVLKASPVVSPVQRTATASHPTPASFSTSFITSKPEAKADYRNIQKSNLKFRNDNANMKMSSGDYASDLLFQRKPVHPVCAPHNDSDLSNIKFRNTAALTVTSDHDHASVKSKSSHGNHSAEDFEIMVTPSEILPHKMQVKNVLPPSKTTSFKDPQQAREKQQRAMQRLDLMVKRQSLPKEEEEKNLNQMKSWVPHQHQMQVSSLSPGKANSDRNINAESVSRDYMEKSKLSDYCNQNVNTKTKPYILCVSQGQKEFKSQKSLPLAPESGQYRMQPQASRSVQPNLLHVMHKKLAEKRAKQKLQSGKNGTSPAETGSVTLMTSLQVPDDSMPDDASDHTIIPDDVSDVFSLADLAAEQPSQFTDDDLDSSDSDDKVEGKLSLKCEAAKVSSVSLALQPSGGRPHQQRHQRENSPDEGVSTKAMPFKDLLKTFEVMGGKNKPTEKEGIFSLRKCISNDNIKTESPRSFRAKGPGLRLSSGSDTELNCEATPVMPSISYHRQRRSSGSDTNCKTDQPQQSNQKKVRARIKTIVKPKKKP